MYNVIRKSVAVIKSTCSNFNEILLKLNIIKGIMCLRVCSAKILSHLCTIVCVIRI